MKDHLAHVNIEVQETVDSFDEQMIYRLNITVLDGPLQDINIEHEIPMEDIKHG